MRVLAIFLEAAVLFAQQKQNMVRSRGQIPIPDRSQSITHGRLGRQDLLPVEPQIVSGILVDGSCDNRGALNLSQPPETMPAPLPQQSAGASAFGITVDARTLEDERSDALAHQVPDLRMRQPDPTCAVTGQTSSFALLLPNGQLLNLDEGGNTLAAQFLNSDPAGRALLNGTGAAMKPWMTVQGRLDRATLIVQKIARTVGGPT
jgi:hypothetical protein